MLNLVYSRQKTTAMMVPYGNYQRSNRKKLEAKVFKFLVLEVKLLIG